MILVWQFVAVLMVTVVNCQSHVWFKIHGIELCLTIPTSTMLISLVMDTML